MTSRIRFDPYTSPPTFIASLMPSVYSMIVSPRLERQFDLLVAAFGIAPQRQPALAVAQHFQLVAAPPQGRQMPGIDHRQPVLDRIEHAQHERDEMIIEHFGREILIELLHGLGRSGGTWPGSSAPRS